MEIDTKRLSSSNSREYHELFNTNCTMAWSFRKRIKIAPGVHINLSKSGVSTSIGPKGAKVTMGPKGTYLHTGIPGTGIYNRQKIGPGQGGTTPPSSPSALGSFQSPNRDMPKKPSNSKGCLSAFIICLLLFSIGMVVGAIMNIDETKKALSPSEFCIVLY